MEDFEGLGDYDFSSVASSVLHSSRNYKLRETAPFSKTHYLGENWAEDQKSVCSNEMREEPDMKGKSSLSKDEIPQNPIFLLEGELGILESGGSMIEEANEDS